MFKQFSLKLILPFFVFVSVLSCFGKQNPVFVLGIEDNCSPGTCIESPNESSSLLHILADPKFDSQDENEEDEHEEQFSPFHSALQLTQQLVFNADSQQSPAAILCHNTLSPAYIPSYILYCCLKICQ